MNILNLLASISQYFEEEWCLIVFEEPSTLFVSILTNYFHSGNAHRYSVNMLKQTLLKGRKF